MLQYLAALVLAVHGIGHISGFLASWISIDADFSDEAWILPGDYTFDSSVGLA